MIQFERAVKLREELTGQGARAKLADDPEQLAKFDELYDAARYAYPLTEDHAFYIDQMGVVLFRAVRAGGRRRARPQRRDRQRRRRVLPPPGRGPVERWQTAATSATSSSSAGRGRGGGADIAACRSSARRLRRRSRVTSSIRSWTPSSSRLLGIKAPAEGDQDANLIDGVAGSPGIIHRRRPRRAFARGGRRPRGRRGHGVRDDAAAVGADVRDRRRGRLRRRRRA